MKKLVVGIVVGLVWAPGCGAKVDEMDDGGESDDAGEEDTDGGIISDGVYADCSTIPPGGATLMPDEVSALGFPTLACNPRTDGEGSFAVYQCCSTDPAAPNGSLPAYQGKNISGGGTPLFSGMNNALGTWGVCVDTTAIPSGSGLLEPAAQDCPIPCNPTWQDSEIDVVCGTARSCCQATELQMADCVQDDDGTWRAVTGEDIGAVTDWAPGAHATHQDPAGTGCLAFAGGDANSDIFADCIRQLTAADQRGFCMALGTDGVCPDALPSYVDACELLNQ